MTGFPRRFDEIGGWAERNGVALVEARRRFAQFVILAAIASSASLRSSLVFKGGNALDFIWQPNRSTLDLDFSIDHQHLAFAIEEDAIRQLFVDALRAVAQHYAVQLAVNSVRQQPPGPNRTFPIWVVRVGYALPDELRLRARMDHGRPSPHALDVEISVNEPIGAAAATSLDDMMPPLRVATLEDIVAEKLRALLQQPIRNRERRQDLLDIAVIVRTHPELDLHIVSDILLAKSEARGIDPNRRSFHDPEVRRRAAVDYERLRDTTRVVFIPFEEAWDEVMELIAGLSISDE